MLQPDESLAIGMSYSGKEIKKWLEANPDSAIAQKLNKLPHFKDIDKKLPDCIYYRVVSEIRYHGKNQKVLDLSLERDWVKSPRSFGKIGGYLNDRK